MAAANLKFTAIQRLLVYRGEAPRIAQMSLAGIANPLNLLTTTIDGAGVRGQQQRRRRRALFSSSAAAQDDVPPEEEEERHPGDSRDDCIHPPKDLNSFEVLGVDPPAFDVDPDALKATYRELMTRYHPDKYHHHSSQPSSPSDEREQDDETQRELMASLVTRAYDTLKEPHTRATHLLEVLGRPILEAASGELVGPEFLLEIMELREAVQEQSDQDRLKEMLDANRRKMVEACDELTAAFQNDDLDKAMELSAQLQYWYRIEGAIREKIDRFD